MKPNLFILACLILVISVPTLAIELPQTSETQDGFKVKLPADWVKATPSELQQMTDEMNNIFQKQKQQFDYGFHPKALSQTPPSPAILIQVERSGRPAENQYAQYTKVPSNLMRKTDAQAAFFLNQFSRNRAMYDAQNKILWKCMEFRSRSATAKVFFIFKLTEFGIVKLTMFAPEEQLQSYLPLFHAVAVNLELSPDSVYQSKWIEKFPVIGGLNGFYLLLILVLLGCVAIIYYTKFKGKKD